MIELNDYAVGRDAVEHDAVDLGMARIEIEERLVLHRTFRFAQVLPTESLVGKHSEVSCGSAVT